VFQHVLERQAANLPDAQQPLQIPVVFDGHDVLPSLQLSALSRPRNTFPN
jgi:hypothetical protein